MQAVCAHIAHWEFMYLLLRMLINMLHFLFRWFYIFLIWIEYAERVRAHKKTLRLIPRTEIIAILSA